MEIVVILHNIRSLHNVGSIFRTADAAGVKKIYLCGITPSPIDVFGKARPQLTKVSLGAEKYVEWEKVKSTARLIDKLKKAKPRSEHCSAIGEKYKIFAIEQSKKAVPYHKIKLYEAKSRKIVLVVGNEIKGLPASILKKTDKILEIPMRGKKESLNVAVAFGIIIFDIINS